MGALAVVESFDVIEEFGAGMSLILKAGAIDQFEFQGAPEALHRGVVIAIAPAAHRRDQTGLCEGLAVIGRGVLDSAIGMEEEVFERRVMAQSHAQRIQDQGGVDPWAHAPAHDFAAVEIENGGQVKPAFGRADVSDVADPDLFGSGGPGQLGQSIGSDGMRMIAVGRLNAPPAWLAATEALLPS